jgi:hypothetical protein
LFANELDAVVVSFNKKALTIKPNYEGTAWVNKHIVLPVRRITTTIDTITVALDESDIEAFLDEYRSVRNELGPVNARTSEMLKTLNHVFGMSIDVDGNLNVTRCKGKGINGWLKGYSLDDIIENADLVLEAIGKSFRKRIESKELALNEFEAKMKALGIFRKSS